MENENVLILGLGGVGMHLTKRLSNEGHAVTVIETDPYLIRQASEQLDVRICLLYTSPSPRDDT